MNRYIYPQNLKARANLWFWSLRDFAILVIAALFSALVIAGTKFMLPAALTLCYGFLTIRMDDTTIMEYIKYAVKYFISTQQYFKWKQR